MTLAVIERSAPYARCRWALSHRWGPWGSYINAGFKCESRRTCLRCGAEEVVIVNG
jgi:hypothetical protein